MSLPILRFGPKLKLFWRKTNQTVFTVSTGQSSYFSQTLFLFAFITFADISFRKKWEGLDFVLIYPKEKLLHESLPHRSLEEKHPRRGSSKPGGGGVVASLSRSLARGAKFFLGVRGEDEQHHDCHNCGE